LWERHPPPAGGGAAAYPARADLTSVRSETSGTGTSHQCPPAAVLEAGSVSMTRTDVRSALRAAASALASCATPCTLLARAARLRAWATRSSPSWALSEDVRRLLKLAF